MSYKSILSVVSDTDLVLRTARQAAVLTQAFDGHLEMLALGIDRTQTGYYYAGANAMVLQESLSRASAEAKDLGQQVEQALGREGALYSVEEGVAPLADLGRLVAGRARFADLVVLPRPYGSGRGVELEPIIEGALFEGQAPVLVLPEEGDANPRPERVLIGWNESPEALRAMRVARPFLESADLVHIVVIDPPAHGPDRSDPGGQLAQYLSRHGIRAEIDVLSKTMPRVSDVLMRHVTDVNADLVVMGAYGHSRFREAILGGATRNMLEQAAVPVLMAH